MGVGRGDGDIRARGKDKRIYIPAMPMPLATLCCVLNFIIPGIGTIVAGLSVCCCARNEDMGGGQRCGSCTISILFGILQLILTVLLIGWVWSCVWGVMMIGMSSEYYHDNPVHSDTTRYPVNQQQQQPAVPGYQYGQGGVPNQGYPVPNPYPQNTGYPPTQPYQPPTNPYPPAQPHPNMGTYPQPGQMPPGPPYAENRVEPSAPLEPPPPYSPT